MTIPRRESREPIHCSTLPMLVWPAGRACSSASRMLFFCTSPFEGGTLMRSFSSNSTNPAVSRWPSTRCASAAAHQRA